MARLRQALTKDPARRPGAAALLRHPWLAGRHPLPWPADLAALERTGSCHSHAACGAPYGGCQPGA